MSIIKKALGKALGTIGLKPSSSSGAFSSSSGYRSRSLAKLTTNTATPKYAVRSYYDKYLGGE